MFRCGCNPAAGRVCSAHCQWQGCTETAHTAACLRGERIERGGVYWDARQGRWTVYWGDEEA